MQTNITATYKSILLALLDPPGEIVRLSIDPAYIRELADSIRVQGLLQPLVVRPMNGRYEIIAGHCRFLAISSLGLTHVSCHVKEASDEETALARCMENLQRFDMSPIEEARAYQALHERFSLSYESIGQKTGKTPTLVKRRIDLLKLPQEVITAIHERKISYSVGDTLCQIPDLNTCKYYLELAIENGITNDVAKLWVKEWKDAQRRSASDDVPMASLANPTISKPIYLSCDACHGAVDLAIIKRIMMCPDCFKILLATTKGGDK